MFVYGGGSIKKIGLYDQVKTILNDNKISFRELNGVKPNPDIESVREGIKLCRKHKLNFIFAAGGGSVIDCAKAIAAGFYYDGDPWDFFERKTDITNALPLGTVLTLSAAGSEMNGNSVISNSAVKEKRGIGNHLLRPKFTILDPEYTFSVGKEQTAAGVVDIMSHLFEQYFSSIKNTDIQDRFAESLIKVCIKFGPIALKEPGNYEARANLMWASSLSLHGLVGYGKMGDWSTHQIEHEISAVYDITHAVGLAILTPNWMKYVLNDETAYKFAEYTKNVWGIEGSSELETAKLGIKRTREFFNELCMPAALSEIGIDDRDIETMAAGAVKFGPIGNFRKLNYNNVVEILKMSL